MDSITLPTRQISIQLLDEGVDVWRPTQAIDLGNGLFKILALPEGNFADEKWEFPPGSIVRGEEKMLYQGVSLTPVLVAVKA